MNYGAGYFAQERRYSGAAEVAELMPLEGAPRVVTSRKRLLARETSSREEQRRHRRKRGRTRFFHEVYFFASRAIVPEE